MSLLLLLELPQLLLVLQVKVLVLKLALLGRHRREVVVACPACETFAGDCRGWCGREARLGLGFPFTPGRGTRTTWVRVTQNIQKIG